MRSTQGVGRRDQDAGRRRTPISCTPRARTGVVVWPDVLGLRPRSARWASGSRISATRARRKSVLPVNARRWCPTARASPISARDAVLALAQALNSTTHTTDAKAFVAWLDTQPAVDKNKKIGTTGYCTGRSRCARRPRCRARRRGACSMAVRLRRTRPTAPTCSCRNQSAIPLRDRRQRRHATPTRRIYCATRSRKPASRGRGPGRDARLVRARRDRLRQGQGGTRMEPPLALFEKALARSRRWVARLPRPSSRGG
jgi:hypothetical protein